jgi:hypothetical protein
MKKEIRNIRMAAAALAAAIAMALCVSCAGGDAPKPPEVMGEEWGLAKGADVYVVGACGRLFKNGLTYSLGDTRIRAGNAVFVSGGDVYVACETYPAATGGDSRALLWKNGETIYLDEASSRASAILVSGGDVYMAGHRRSRAALWVDGEPRRLDDGGESLSEAYSAFVSGGDVHVGGTASWVSGLLWKNGAVRRVNPPGGRYARVNSVFVSGEDVHAAVYDWTNPGIARTWLYKNGDLTLLGNDASPRSVIVSGGDVYVLGNETHETVRSIMIPVLWKNGVKQRLTDGSRFAWAHSLCVANGDVYVAGYVSGGGNGSIPTLWINGEAVDLRPSGMTDKAWGVFVVEKGE